MKKKLISLFILLIVVIFLSTMAYLKNESSSLHKTSNFSERSINIHEKELTQDQIEEITIAGIGDILIHDRVYNDAREGDTFNFDKMFQNVTPELNKPTILLANQETIVAGESIGLSGYPSFNSPHEVADSVKAAGIDIVTTANNHSLDRGVDAQKQSISYLDSISLPHVGTYTSHDAQKQVTTLFSGGIKVAFLSYTYGLNGIPIPEGKDYIVNIIDEQKIKEEISRAKKEADVIVMGIHWGSEYERYPSASQKKLAQMLVNEGVDIIFGSHPHVLQPMEWLEGKDGNKGLVVYSLGNFLSGQDEEYRDIGGMVSVRVQKTTNQNGQAITLLEPTFYPTFVSSEAERNYIIHPLKDSEAAIEKYDSSIYEKITNHMLQYIK